jgi:hypothetical protein
LGASDYLAGDWPGRVLHLWPEAQSRAGSGSECRTEDYAHNGGLKLIFPRGLPPYAEGLFVVCRACGDAPCRTPGYAHSSTRRTAVRGPARTVVRDVTVPPIPIYSRCIS